jgi:hypothetical protein
MQCRSSSKIAPDQFGRTIGYGTGFVNSSAPAGSAKVEAEQFRAGSALKALEKLAILTEISLRPGPWGEPR